MDNLNQYCQLKLDILALKEYIIEKYDIELNPRVDYVMAEINDLLLGIERGQLSMPYKELKLSATWSATDGAYDDDTQLREMIYKIQDDIYSIKKFINVLHKPKLFFRKNQERINWLFPNLDCKSGIVECIEFRAEDMMTITFANGYEIDLGFFAPEEDSEKEYIITITKDDNWTSIIEQERIKLRCKVEEILQNFINKYENL